MLTIGDKFPSFDLKAVVSTDARTAFKAYQRQERRRQVEGRVLLAEGLHLRLPDRDRRLRQAQPATSTTATRVLYGVSTDTEFVHLAWRKNHADLKTLPFPMLADIKRELSHGARHPRQDRRRRLRATFIVDPEASSASSRSTTSPSAATRGSAARARRAADRRALPLQLAEGRRRPEGRLRRHPCRSTS